MSPRSDLVVLKRGAASATPARKQLNSETVAKFPVAGIGASAGGLEAFLQLLKGLPTDTGMAFVLVQHLDPKHDSQLADLLDQSHADARARSGERANSSPNLVHVMPSNVLMTVASAGWSSCHAGNTMSPIDCFLRSLAAEYGELGVGVILSGTGADGTAGVEAVKAAGGITFAEDSTSAKFSKMPENAVASGFVDFVLSPERIGMELARIARHPGLQQRTIPKVPKARTRKARHLPARMLRLLRGRVGVDFTHYKKSTLQRRIAHRMVLRGVDNEVEYCVCWRRKRRKWTLFFAMR